MVALPTDLASLLAPASATEFLASTWGRTHRHFRGDAGRFSAMLPWARLEAILRQHRLAHPRINVALDAEDLPADGYLAKDRFHSNLYGGPYIRVPELLRQLRNGATLIVNAVDELHDPITDLAAGLERTFREHVQANAYVCWRTERGFGIHRDAHDVLVLQVTGRKRWSIHGPSKPDAPSPNTHPENPIWEGVMEDGDVLYIPKGTWHGAVGMNVPTLHLTFGFNNRTGINLLDWFQSQLREDPTVRANLPRFATADEQRAFMTDFATRVTSLCNADAMHRFLHEYDGRGDARVALGLPWSVLPDAMPDGDDVSVRLLIARPTPPVAISGRNVVSIAGNGRTWEFPSDAAVILGALVERPQTTLAKLVETAAGNIDRARVRALVKELVLAGVVALRDDGP